MAEGTVRINCDGLIAVAIKDPDNKPELVKRVDLIFINPENTLPSSPTPEAHRPRLEIQDANLIDWSLTSLTPEPNVTPLTFSLTGWQVSVRPDGLPPSGTVNWPQRDRPDSDPRKPLRMLSSQKRLLDLKSICGESTLDGAFIDTQTPHADVLGFLTLETGVAFTMSTDTGNFDKWTFEGISFEQEAADSLALFVEAEEFVTFQLTWLKDPALIKTITVKCKDRASTIALRHACRSTNSCKQHKGNHVMQYYKMTSVPPSQKPNPIPPTSESSYCPPAGFSEA